MCNWTCYLVLHVLFLVKKGLILQSDPMSTASLRWHLATFFFFLDIKYSIWIFNCLSKIQVVFLSWFGELYYKFFLCFTAAIDIFWYIHIFLISAVIFLYLISRFPWTTQWSQQWNFITSLWQWLTLKWKLN